MVRIDTFTAHRTQAASTAFAAINGVGQVVRRSRASIVRRQTVAPASDPGIVKCPSRTLTVRRHQVLVDQVVDVFAEELAVAVAESRYHAARMTRRGPRVVIELGVEQILLIPHTVYVLPPAGSQ